MEVRPAGTKLEMEEAKRDEIVVRRIIKRLDRIRSVGLDWRGIFEE